MAFGLATAILALGVSSWLTLHDWPAFHAAFLAGWPLGLIVVIRNLRSARTLMPRYSVSWLAGAALTASLASYVGAVVGAPWNDLLSSPRPTLAIVGLDFFANLLPYVAGYLGARAILTAAGRYHRGDRSGAGLDSTPCNKAMNTDEGS